MQILKAALPVLARLIWVEDDNQVVADAVMALSFLSDGSSEKIHAIIEAGVCKRLCDLLMTYVSHGRPAWRSVFVFSNPTLHPPVPSAPFCRLVLPCGSCPRCASTFNHVLRFVHKRHSYNAIVAEIRARLWCMVCSAHSQTLRAGSSTRLRCVVFEYEGYSVAYLLSRSSEMVAPIFR